MRASAHPALEARCASASSCAGGGQCIASATSSAQHRSLLTCGAARYLELGRQTFCIAAPIVQPVREALGRAAALAAGRAEFPGPALMLLLPSPQPRCAPPPTTAPPGGPYDLLAEPAAQHQRQRAALTRQGGEPPDASWQALAHGGRRLDASRFRRHAPPQNLLIARKRTPSAGAAYTPRPWWSISCATAGRS